MVVKNDYNSFLCNYTKKCMKEKCIKSYKLKKGDRL